MTKGFLKVADVVNNIDIKQDKYISYEFQKYGYELAKQLGDLKNKSMYIKLAKSTPRDLLERTKNYVKDAKNVKNITALFLWKLSQIKSESKKKGLKDHE